jgi:hypothetical protein
MIKKLMRHAHKTLTGEDFGALRGNLMKSLLLALGMVLAGLALWAADVWVSKPYTDWSAKDVDKIMTDSPWAKPVTVILDLGRGSGSAGGAPSPEVNNSGGADPGVAPPETNLCVRWQTAPTLMQALVKWRYGAQAGTSEKAQKSLRPEDRYYVIWVAGLPNSAGTRDRVAKASLLALTTLAVKRKDAIVATDVLFDPGPGRGRITDAHFVFPRKIAFSPDDKEIEFTTHFGKTKVQAKFALKSMVIDGRLEL